MVDTDGAERRQHKRHQFEIETQLRVDFETVVELELEREYYDARTSDISLGGVSLFCPLALPSGSTFDLHVRIVEGQHAQTPPQILPARTVWSTEISEDRHQVGARFVDLDEKQWNALDELIAFIESNEDAEPEEQRRSWDSLTFDLSDSRSDDD